MSKTFEKVAPATETVTLVAQNRQLRAYAELLNAEVWTSSGPVRVPPRSRLEEACDEITSGQVPGRLADHAVAPINMRGSNG